MSPETQQLIAEQYPEFSAAQGWRLEVLAIELIELEETPPAIAQIAIDLKYNEGFFEDSAIIQAIEASSRRLTCPKGYLYVEVVKEDERVLLMLKV